MKPSDQKWSRLARAARSAPDTRDTAAPYGFATRVAALAMAQERVVGSLLERFSLRALGLAGLLALVCVAANLSTVTGLFREEALALTDDSWWPRSLISLVLSDGQALESHPRLHRHFYRRHPGRRILTLRWVGISPNASPWANNSGRS